MSDVQELTRILRRSTGYFGWTIISGYLVNAHIVVKVDSIRGDIDTASRDKKAASMRNTNDVGKKVLPSVRKMVAAAEKSRIRLRIEAEPVPFDRSDKVWHPISGLPLRDGSSKYGMDPAYAALVPILRPDRFVAFANPLGSSNYAIGMMRDGKCLAVVMPMKAVVS